MKSYRRFQMLNTEKQQHKNEWSAVDIHNVFEINLNSLLFHIEYNTMHSQQNGMKSVIGVR